MKKIVASVGLVALGASGLQAASLSGFTADATKPWSVSATLRGFYDDNINSLANDLNPSDFVAGAKRDSFGFEVSPSVNLNWHLDQTSLQLGYVFSYKYYENKPMFNTGHEDLSHIFTLSLSHAFNERHNVSVRDSFVIGQEPDMLRAGNSFATFQRVPGDNIRNYGNIDFDGQLTPVLGYEAGYANAYYHYQQTGGDATAPSLGGLLNRLEHNIHLDSRWQMAPQTVGVIGYQYREIDYYENEEIGFVGANPIFSDNRNSRSHIGYLGMDHTFLPDLTGSLRAGAQWTDYFNDPYSSGVVSPYVRASLRYVYRPDSFAELGFTFDRNATDLLGATGDSFTTDAESVVVYGNVRHRILPNFFLNVQGQFQNSTYQNGAFDNFVERFYLAGLNLEYQFNQYFSTHVGYDYDRLESQIGRTFDRNRVYLGVTASY